MSALLLCSYQALLADRDEVLTRQIHFWLQPPSPPQPQGVTGKLHYPSVFASASRMVPTSTFCQMVTGLRSSFCLFPLPHPGPAMTASNSRAGTAPADCLDHPRIPCGSHSPWHWQTGSGAEPGASPFILAKLQQTRQVSARFVFVTPTRPCLALPNVAAAIHTIPAEQ